MNMVKVFAALAALMLSATAAMAAPVTVFIGGVLTDDGGAELTPGLSDDFYISVTFDDAVAPSSTTATFATYQATSAFLVFFEGATPVNAQDAPPTISLTNDSFDALVFDFTPDANLGLRDMQVSLFASAGAALNGTGLSEVVALAQAGDLSGFPGGRITIDLNGRTGPTNNGPLGLCDPGPGDFDECFMVADVTSFSLTAPMAPVPLPAAGVMLAFGLGGLVALRRRGRAA